ncbi:cupin domain-containing protein [Microbacterium sp. NPDC028030]|uniref:cupin domain-containing protein n=1 Tax=Microbacterium sp. NPDC028030 TaxID=3155124 RepID=UPI00340FF9EF
MSEDLRGAVSRDNAEHYVWGGVSDGWRLLDDEGLSVIEERVPAGAGEEWHVHDTADQFFYVLEGHAEMQTEAGARQLTAGEGLHVQARLAHRFFNPGSGDVRFLVISAPNTRADRRAVEFRVDN